MSDLKELSQRQISLERVVPLNSNRLVTFVNHFIISIVQQLNELTSVVDSRLYDLNNQILRCNANLVILEMKLNSISGLSSVSSVANTDTNANNNSIQLSQTTTKTDINSVEDKQTEDTNSSVKSETTNDTNEQQIEGKVEVEEQEAEEPKEEEVEDPRIAKYKKMVHLGIPLDAVHQKMRLEGVDPQLLKH